MSDNYNATVLFGDNNTGISPSENASYLVQYRIGGGTRGNIPNNYLNLTVPVAVGTGQAAPTNISKGTGGSNAETIEHAKRYAPLTFRRQDRLVTLEDYSVLLIRLLVTMEL
jgi:hypothetical protein